MAPAPTIGSVSSDATDLASIEAGIQTLRGHNVLLSTDLAMLYSVTTSGSVKLDRAFPGEMPHFSGIQSNARIPYLNLSQFQDMVPCASQRDPANAHCSGSVHR